MQKDQNCTSVKTGQVTPGMNDQRVQQPAPGRRFPRREDYREARARLLGMCGQHTMMCDRERLETR